MVRSSAERGRAGNLRQPAGGGAAHQLHLEQPVARMDEAERRGGIGRVGGADARDAVGVEPDIDRARSGRGCAPAATAAAGSAIARP